VSTIVFHFISVPPSSWRTRSQLYRRSWFSGKFHTGICMDGRATAQKHTPLAPCASLGKRLQQKTGLQNGRGRYC
jgi:hypothetical protein